MSGLKSFVRGILQRIAPAQTAVWVAARSRSRSHRLFREWGLTDLDRRLIAELGDRVVAGPFRGLRLTPMARAEFVGPFLLGTYEAELHPCWHELRGERFAQVIDVGAKFGYYAVGLAQLYPDAAVVAFDIDPWARRATRELSGANATGNVAVESACTPDWFDRNLLPNALIISDCEGYEDTLFRAPIPAAMRSATLLIETHDHVSPGVTESLRALFGASHSIQQIDSAASHLPPEVKVETLTREELSRAAQEVRGPQSWLYCRPRVQPNSA